MATPTPITGVTFHDPNDDPEDEDRSEYTVPIPDDLTDTFNPINPNTGRPVTGEEAIRYATDGIEPYDGYADELAEWERRWELVNDAQALADGEPIHRVDVIHPAPETDGLGLPIRYDEPNRDVDELEAEAEVRRRFEEALRWPPLRPAK